MGLQLFDQYTLLHFAVGCIFYFWGIRLFPSMIIHILFETIENTPWGMKLINSFSYWPGGKPYADSIVNSIGDSIGFFLGWVISYYLDKIGSKRKWYDPHFRFE